MSTVHPSNIDLIDLDPYSVHLAGPQMEGRTFLLGNQAGFTVYLPTEMNSRDATLSPVKWFGASGFGRQYLAASRIWIDINGERAQLDRQSQTEFAQTLYDVVRTYVINGVTVQQRFWVPRHCAALMMSLEASASAAFVVEPEFDMRYYQTFNHDFSQYSAVVRDVPDGQRLDVSNHVAVGSPTVPHLDFYAVVGSVGGSLHVDLLPDKARLRRKTFLKDEYRMKLIQSVYSETHVSTPDEAPIWDQYSTMVYAPARLSGDAPLHLVFGFSEVEGDADETVMEVGRSYDSFRQSVRLDAQTWVQQGQLKTGDPDVDRAYTQVLSRFNACLVARDMVVHGNTTGVQHFSAIFAGNKYFLDAWKRDENISLQALLLTGDGETTRSILDDTWQFQDERTGRLPHIIRLGEPLVYYSSDGTLWALRRLWEYTREMGDPSLMDAKYPMVEHFFLVSLDSVQRGLLPSGGVIEPTYLWETWEDTPFTPRDGYPVEIELLWLTALDDYLPLIEERNPALAEKMKMARDEGRETFHLFYLDGYLADSLSYSWEPRTFLTPNGYFAFDVKYPLPPSLARSMMLLGRDQLAGRVGIRSLAPRDWSKVLSPEFMANPAHFRGMNMASVGIYNYHRGVEWLWLNKFLVEAELQYGDAQHAYDLYVRGLVHETLREGGVGGLSELYDTRGPLGADFQAWSMAGFMSALHSFAGIKVDTLDNAIRVRPCLPDSWPELTCRRQMGGRRFDVRCSQKRGDFQTVEVTPVDSLPSGACLHVGSRVPAHARDVTVSIDDRIVASDKAQVRRTENIAGETWVTVPLAGHVRVTFEFHGAVDASRE